MNTALRVLAAAVEHREPEETDMEVLRSYAPLSTRRHPDELAREVIQQVLKARGRFTDGMAEKVEEPCGTCDSFASNLWTIRG